MTASISEPRRPRRGMLLAAALAALAAGGCTRGEGASVGPVATVAASGASNPTVARGPSGETYIAWVGAGPGGQDVYLARRAPGERAWSAPVRVNDVDGDAAPHEQAPAQVAVGPDGTVYVVWQNNRTVPGRRFPASDLRLARSTDGGRTFAPAITVNDDAGGPPSSHTFHNIVVAADGSVYVAWLDSRVRDAAERESGGAADRAKPAGAPTSTATAPSGAVPHSASAMRHHGATTLTDPGSEVRFAISTDGGRSFSASRVIDANACPCCRTALATAADGSVYVAWRKVYPGNVRDVVVARKAPGAADFGAPVRVGADGWVYPGCPHAGPALAVDARGRVHVGWYTGATNRQGLWYAVSADQGRSWSAPVALETAAWVPPSQVKLAAAGNTVWVAWDDRRTDPRTVTVARADGPGAPRVIAAATTGASPALAASADGAIVAWLDGQAVRARAVGGGDAGR